MTSTTALTVQNTKGVTGVHVIPSDFVARQIEACLEDVGADVIKTGEFDTLFLHNKGSPIINRDVYKKGMLASAETIQVIAKLVTRFKIPTLVIDPVRDYHNISSQEMTLTTSFQVMVSTSGAQLLPHEAIAQLSQHLLPHATILTPNIPEATLLLTQNGHQVGEVQSVSDVEAMGRKIQQLGPSWVLVKGGHMPFRKDMSVAKTDEEKEIIVDVLVGPEGSVLRVQSPCQKSTSTHGTGCSLACKYPTSTKVE